MNTSITSREAILITCRQLVSENGLHRLNMREVAKVCGVALGALYYYFPSKNDMVIATIESVWEDIFRLQDMDASILSFPEYIERCFKHIQEGMIKYPNFFTIHSISLSSKDQNIARISMERYLSKIKEKMLDSLKMDEKVNKSAFSSDFCEEDFVGFVLTNMICILVQKNNSCKLLLEIINRTIY